MALPRGADRAAPREAQPQLWPENRVPLPQTIAALDANWPVLSRTAARETPEAYVRWVQRHESPSHIDQQTVTANQHPARAEASAAGASAAAAPTLSSMALFSSEFAMRPASLAWDWEACAWRLHTARPTAEEPVEVLPRPPPHPSPRQQRERLGSPSPAGSGDGGVGEGGVLRPPAYRRRLHGGTPCTSPQATSRQPTPTQCMLPQHTSPGTSAFSSVHSSMLSSPRDSPYDCRPPSSPLADWPSHAVESCPSAADLTTKLSAFSIGMSIGTTATSSPLTSPAVHRDSSPGDGGGYGGSGGSSSSRSSSPVGSGAAAATALLQARGPEASTSASDAEHHTPHRHQAHPQERLGAGFHSLVEDALCALKQDDDDMAMPPPRPRLLPGPGQRHLTRSNNCAQSVSAPRQTPLRRRVQANDRLG